MDEISAYIEENFDRFAEELAALIRIPSVSTEERGLEECAGHLAGRLREIGLDAGVLPMGGPRNPPLVYGRLDPPGAKRTLLIYGHFDVQPPDPLDAWESPPFEPVLREGRIFGRGAADNKGQLHAVLKGIEALRAAGGGVPLNLRIVLDPEEEIGSPMLEGFVAARPELFRADFGYNCDGAMAEGNLPMLSFGSRGSCYIEARVKVSDRDTHSGQFGGPMPNGAWRLVAFLRTLLDAEGRVAVEGFYDNVVPPSGEERAALEALPFDEAAWRAEMGIAREAGPPGAGHFEKLMFLPALSICGLTSGYQGPGTKTVIPCAASAKIDMRLVPDQAPEEIFEKIRAHTDRRGFRDVQIDKSAFQYLPSRTPIGHPMSRALAAAVRATFGREPLLYPLTGSSNPGHVFRDAVGMPFIRAPVANYDMKNHAPNENLRIDHYRKGIHLTTRVISELAALG